MRRKSSAAKNSAEPKKNICVRPYFIVRPFRKYLTVVLVQKSKGEIPGTKVKLPGICLLLRHGFEDVRNAPFQVGRTHEGIAGVGNQISDPGGIRDSGTP